MKLLESDEKTFMPNCNPNLYCALFLPGMPQSLEQVKESRSITLDVEHSSIALTPIVSWDEGIMDINPIPCCVGTGVALYMEHDTVAIYDANLKIYTTKTGHTFSGDNAELQYSQWALNSMVNRTPSKEEQEEMDDLFEAIQKQAHDEVHAEIAAELEEKHGVCLSESPT